MSSLPPELSQRRPDVPPKAIYNVSDIDFERVKFGPEQIREIIPQRFEFEQLTAVHDILPEEGLIIGWRDIAHDEFWVRGHIPGNPLFPGVLMIESAAQLCSVIVFQTTELGRNTFFAFSGVNAVKFRGTVRPGDRLVLISKGTTLAMRRSVFSCQGFVDGVLVFEGEIVGFGMKAT